MYLTVIETVFVLGSVIWQIQYIKKILD